MKKYLLLLIVIVFIFPVINCNKGADDLIPVTAKITFSIGDVKVKETDKWQSVVENMLIPEGSELKTGTQAQCNILIGTDSFVIIKEKSHLKLDKLLKDATGIEQNTLELKFGKSVINPKKLLKGESFKIKTPTAIV